MTASIPLEPEAARDALARPAFDLLSHLGGQVGGAAPRRIGVLHTGPAPAGGRIGALFPGAVIETLDLRRPDSAPDVGRDPYDLIASEGAIEWRPALRRLLPRLTARLRDGGALAALLPNDLYEPYRAAARLVAADGPWTNTLLPVAKTRPFNVTLEQLYALLKPWCASVEVWETTALRAFDSVEAIAAAVGTVALAPFLAPLDAPSRAQFLDRYLSGLREAYPAQAGEALVRLPMIYVVARR
ncbi:trans-aconitate methyltransferase [Roseiarcus fermentans]|uniref:Trans-aconitate methyltransferase n=1 Tax=Roseiarcus fermentans TaxID=1473586 RepID=A0A366EVT9_9HYPH|nr:hypothetical protein [Roseiarcus fermentans]RBP06454.1 trans-aconitate methyltransferase [Roseiarcus fermentans]